jgi:sialic acid synthase SpsE
LKTKFDSLKIGYADHSEFNSEDAIESNLYARLLGASIFEKHITLKEGDADRVDYISAISQEKVTLIIKKLDRLDDVIDSAKDDFFIMSESEKIYRDRELKVVSSRAIPKNTRLRQDDLCLRMIDKSNGFSIISEVIGQKTVEEINEHTLITKDLLL